MHIPPIPRPYQQDDVDAIIAAHSHTRRVLGRAATGLGKAFELAMLAAHYSTMGRVIIIVDLLTLAEQLAETVEWITGMKPGIEAAERKATRTKDCLFGQPEKIIVAMAQTLSSGERYKDFPPEEISCVLLDECETFVPKDAIYRKPVDYWLNGNPKTLCYGCTATPMRSDGVPMVQLFDYVAVNRDIIWGIDNGWLVPVKQGWVQVTLDLSTVQLSKDADGGIDFSEDDLSEKINNNKTLIELATGIIEVSKDRRTIVVCPKKEICEALSGWINKLKPGSSNFLHSTLPKDLQTKALLGHKQGQTQYLCSVMMLTKGYDDPQVSCIVNCRKTKSPRLYQQILGRGTRVLKGILDGMEELLPLLRRECIEDSEKSDMLMVNMVGLESEVIDMTVLDILGSEVEKKVLDRAKIIAREQEETEPMQCLALASCQIKEESDASLAVSELEWESLQNATTYESWQKLQLEAKVDVEWEELGANRARMDVTDTKYTNSVAVLDKAGWPSALIQQLGHAGVLDKARETIRRHKLGLATFKQCRLLLRNGWSKDGVKYLSKESAKQAIDKLMQKAS